MNTKQAQAKAKARKLAEKFKAVVGNDYVNDHLLDSTDDTEVDFELIISTKVITYNGKNELIEIITENNSIMVAFSEFANFMVKMNGMKITGILAGLVNGKLVMKPVC